MMTPAQIPSGTDPSQTDPAAGSPAVDAAAPPASSPGTASSPAASSPAVASAASAPPTQKPLPVWRERLKVLIAESGAIVLWVYFGIFGIVLVSFALAIQFGVNVQGVAGTAGTWGAAYLATKLTQPLRIAATLAITPALASFLRRFRSKRAQQQAALPPSELPPSRQP
jgi:hypothetical protein